MQIMEYYAVVQSAKNGLRIYGFLFYSELQSFIEKCMNSPLVKWWRICFNWLLANELKRGIELNIISIPNQSNYYLTSKFIKK